MINIMLIMFFTIIIIKVEAHNHEVFSNSILESKENYHNSPDWLRRREWQFGGIPIEIPNRRYLKVKLVKKDEDTSQATETTTSTITVPTETPLPSFKRTRRIFNADEITSIVEHPYMAAVLVNMELWCGGVLIAKDQVLTAAHCLQLQYNNRFFREYVKMLSVRLGSSNTTAGGVVMKVSEIFFHPNYKPKTLDFNVAVLRLHKNVTNTNKIQAIDYSNMRVVPEDRNILFLGWGSTSATGGIGGAVLLQQIMLPVYKRQDCQDIYGADFVTRNTFCAGYISILKNVCNHDAGGPALMDGKLVGILSFSHSRCDVLDKPAVFTTVGVMSSWLDDINKQLLNRKKLKEAAVVEKI